jgi:glutathione S-transferase
MAKLKLYHWEPVTECAKVMICLREMGLDFSSQYVDILEFKQYARRFLNMNPAGQVPVLVYGREAISESTLINEFLLEAFPGKNLAPTDPKGWYELQAWGKYLDFNLGTSVATLGWQQAMLPLMKQRDQKKLQKAVAKIPIVERRAAWSSAIGDGSTPDQIANSRRKIELAVKRMEGILADSPWLMGDDYTVIDINAYALASSLPRLVPEIVGATTAPRLLNWLDRIRSRPAVMEVEAMRTLKEPRDVYAPGPEHSRWG